MEQRYMLRSGINP